MWCFFRFTSLFPFFCKRYGHICYICDDLSFPYFIFSNFLSCIFYLISPFSLNLVKIAIVSNWLTILQANEEKKGTFFLSFFSETFFYKCLWFFRAHFLLLKHPVKTLHLPPMNKEADTSFNISETICCRYFYFSIMKKR